MSNGFFNKTIKINQDWSPSHRITARSICPEAFPADITFIRVIQLIRKLELAVSME